MAGRSGCPAVLMDQAAKHVDAFDPAGSRQRGHCRRWRGYRGLKFDAAVRPAGVVVLDIPGEDPLKVLLVPDQCPVQTLGPGGAHPPLGVRVRPRRPWWDLDRLDADGGEHSVEGGGELRVPVTNQQTEPIDL